MSLERSMSNVCFQPRFSTYDKPTWASKNHFQRPRPNWADRNRNRQSRFGAGSGEGWHAIAQATASVVLFSKAGAGHCGRGAHVDTRVEQCWIRWEGCHNTWTTGKRSEITFENQSWLDFVAKTSKQWQHILWTEIKLFWATIRRIKNDPPDLVYKSFNPNFGTSISYL